MVRLLHALMVLKKDVDLRFFCIFLQPHSSLNHNVAMDYITATLISRLGV